MSALPKEALLLKGGCYCSTVRYEIRIPPLADRPPLLPDDPIHRLPTITFDHCNDCRKAAGSLLPSWILCARSWITFFLPKSKEPFPARAGCTEGANIVDVERISIPAEEFVHRPESLDGFVTAFNSSPNTWRTFCSRCGTGISFACLDPAIWGEDVGKIDMVFGSLDRDSLEVDGVRPDAHLYWKYGVDWVQKLVTEGDVTVLGERLPRHPSWNRSESS